MYALDVWNAAFCEYHRHTHADGAVDTLTELTFRLIREHEETRGQAFNEMGMRHGGGGIEIVCRRAACIELTARANEQGRVQMEVERRCARCGRVDTEQAGDPATALNLFFSPFKWHFVRIPDIWQFYALNVSSAVAIVCFAFNLGQPWNNWAFWFLVGEFLLHLCAFVRAGRIYCPEL
jgi:hypothetical protein